MCRVGQAFVWLSTAQDKGLPDSASARRAQVSKLRKLDLGIAPTQEPGLRGRPFLGGRFHGVVHPAEWATSLSLLHHECACSLHGIDAFVRLATHSRTHTCACA